MRDLHGRHILFIFNLRKSSQTSSPHRRSPYSFTKYKAHTKLLLSSARLTGVGLIGGSRGSTVMIAEVMRRHTMEVFDFWEQKAAESLVREVQEEAVLCSSLPC